MAILKLKAFCYPECSKLRDVAFGKNVSLVATLIIIINEHINFSNLIFNHINYN